MAERTTNTIDKLCITTIRTLAMDAVEKASSGHPGTPMALAPLAYVLWTRFLKYNPRNPAWFDRDRFILSNGHASMLQYAMLYLTGYDLSLDDIKAFRQWGSRTPGHPEHRLTPGVETTTGPLGQGIMNSVGMAMAEAHCAAIFNKKGHEIVDHFTYAFCSDGDLMEGASHEAASIAGHLGLGKLIWVYDDNHISIEGKTEITYTDDVETRFKGYHWHVQNIGDTANDLESISDALRQAREHTGQPSLIILRSHIAYGAPTKQDTPEAHGSPLGVDEVRATKKFYGWPEDAHFRVPEEVLTHMRSAGERGNKKEKEWQDRYEKYRKTFPHLATQFNAALQGKLPEGWHRSIPTFRKSDGPMATRKAASHVLQSFADAVPWLMGGSGDLAPSTKTLMETSKYFEKGEYAQRNIAWGVREHVMCGASSGLALHGGVRPFASTFFIFTDYARPAIRLASLMQLPVIYLMTHDSIGLGEDGPTHQPVEHLASLRAMPQLCVIRPADANETAYAWRVAMARDEGPTMLVLTRQKLPVLDGEAVSSPAGLRQGAYIIARESGDEPPDLILIASGSEVHLILEARKNLEAEGVRTRAISMPSWELFRQQPREYREGVFPPAVTARIAVEAGAPQGWLEWVGDTGTILGIETFGASAPGSENFAHYGFSAEHIVRTARTLLEELHSDVETTA